MRRWTGSREAVERNDVEGLAGYLAMLIERLAAGGANLAAISAVTPHICIRQLERIFVLPLVDITTTIAAEVRLRGYRRVALFEFNTDFPNVDCPGSCTRDSRGFGVADSICVPLRVMRLR